MTSPVLGEFLGTMILVLLGDGVVAAVLLKRSKAEGSGWMVITAGWAFAVMAGVFTAIACGSSDAHLNPAVTIGFAVRDGNFAKFAPYLVAQLLGAIVGAALVWLHYFPHWKETPDAAAKLGVFLHRAGDSQHRYAICLAKSSERSCLFLWLAQFSQRASRRPVRPRDSVRTLSAAWSGASGCRLAARPGTPSIPRATWGRASRTRFFRLPGKAVPIGAMRRFRWLVLWLAARLQACFCA